MVQRTSRVDTVDEAAAIRLQAVWVIISIAF